MTVDLLNVPDERIAASIACRVMGWSGAAAKRFPTGSAHFVFDVRPEDGGTPVVVRMGRVEQRLEMGDGLHLMQRLAELGVPLPAIVASGTDAPLPWVVMERLPGTDLGDVVRQLPDEQLRAIAIAVAGAQRATLGLGPSVGYGYGYASSASTAPHASWPDVVAANLERSRQRTLEGGFFSLDGVERAARLLRRRWTELERFPASPFLHDTTTKNVIVTAAGAFSGIVDVDDLCFGDPRWAPALTLAVLLAYGGPTRYVDYWMDAAGLADDHLFRLYVAVFLLDLMSEHGLRFNGNERPSTPEARAGVSRAFENAIVAAEA